MPGAKRRVPPPFKQSLYGQGPASVPANDYTNGIEDPDWTPSFYPDGQMSFGQENHGHAGILTLDGLVDTLEHLAEVPEEMIRAFLESDHAKDGSAFPPWLREALKMDRPPAVPVEADIKPSRHFRTTAYSIPAGGEPTLISAQASRTRAIVTNTGATNPAFLSWTQDVYNINTAGDMEWITLNKGVDPTNPRVFQARGRIYCYSPNGTTVDIQEEYGLLDELGEYTSPAGG